LLHGVVIKFCGFGNDEKIIENLVSGIDTRVASHAFSPLAEVIIRGFGKNLSSGAARTSYQEQQ